MKTSIKKSSGYKYALMLILISFFIPNLKANNWEYAQHISSSDNAEINVVESYLTSVFMAGQFTGSLNFPGHPSAFSSTTNSAFIAKYDEDNFVWVNQIEGTIGTINGSTIDTDGNFYVIGAFAGTCTFKSQDPADDTTLTSGGDNDGFIAKYDAQGNLIYAWQVGQSLARNRSFDAVVDQVGNVYVGGFWRGGEIIFSPTVSLNYNSSNAWSEGYLVKFLPDGQVDWAKHISGGANGATRIDGGLTIHNNTIFASISFRTTMEIDNIKHSGTGTQSLALAAFNSNGNVNWVQTATNTNYVTPGNKITSNKEGIYCIGSFNLPSIFSSADGNHITLESKGGFDGFIAKYDFNGNILWTNNIGGFSEDKVWGVATVDDIISTTGHFNGTMYLGNTVNTQDTISNKGHSDTFIVNFLNNGQYIGSTSAGGNLYDEPSTISLDSRGNSIIGGKFSSNSISFGETILENTSGSSDAFLAKHINLRALVTVANITCHDQLDGMITLNGFAGGDEPYTYSFKKVDGDMIDSGIFTEPVIYNNLESGTYRLEAVDALNRTITRYYHIVVPDPIEINGDLTHISGCYANDNGAINLTVTGGTGDYTFFWDTERGYGVSPTTQNQGSLTAGIYNVTVTDANGCTATESFELTQPERINFGESTITNNSSTSSPNGAINLIVNNGAEPYSFNWKEPNGEESNSQNLSGIRGGTYVLYLEDANGCNVDTVFNVLDENKFNAYITQINNPKCKGGTDGSVTIDLENVTGNITIEWSNGQTDVTTATNLSAGEYWVIVTDDMGTPGDDTDDISLEIPALVGEPLFALDVHATVIKTTCPTDNDGSILLTVNGCSSPYEYSWSTTDGSGIVEDEKDQFNLSVGSYSYNVTDMYGCTVNSSVQVFSTYSAPSFTIDVQPDNNVCQGTEVEISVSSGFNYLFVIDDIPQGNYSPNTTLTIEDPVDGMSIKVVGMNTAGCTKESEEIILNVTPNVEPPIFVQGATQLCEGVTETYLATAVNAEFIIYSLVSGSATVDPTTGEVTNITENFTIAATAYGYNNCGEEYVELDVIVNPTPTPVISTTDPLEWLENAAIDVTLSTDITDAEAYQWFHNNNPISGATQSTYQATQAGIYSVEVTVLGCNGLSNEIEITLIPVYTIAFSVEGENNEPVENAEITIAGYEPLFTNDIGTATIELPNGDYTFQISATCYHIYNGTFEVDNSSQMVEVTLNALPTPEFVLGQDMLCEGATETYAAAAEGNLTMIYTIVNGTAAVDPTTGEVTNITEDFTIRATASFADGCEKYTDLEVTVNPTPTPVISTTDPLEWLENAAIDVTLSTDITDAEAYQWFHNNNPISGATQNTYQTTQEGVYYVEVTQLGCNGLSNEIEISLIPVYTIAFSVEGDNNEPFEDAKISIEGYEPLYTNDIGTATIELPNGNYTFQVSVTCYQTFNGIFEVDNSPEMVEVTLNALPEPEFVFGQDMLCEGATETYAAEAEGSLIMIYTIVSGSAAIDPTTGEVTNIIEDFTIRATASFTDGCEKYTDLEVIVNPTPTPVISTTDPLEWLENADIDVTLSTDITDAEAYQWFHNDNPISGATQSSYLATQAGIYSVEVTVLGCSGLSNEIEITLIPVYTIAFSVEGENNEPVVNAEITIAGYEPLYTNDIGTATIDLPNGDYTYQVSATCYHIYNGTFEVNNSSQIIEVTLNALPEPVFVSGQDMLCEGATETFAAEAEGNLTMIYTIVNGTAAVDPTTGEVTNITDDFTIRATASFADGCEKYTDLEVTVNPIPTPAISTTDPLVWTEGEDISVTFVVDITDGEAYQWLRNDEIISGATENSYQATQAGTYSVEVTRLGCTGVSNSLEITLIPVDTYTVSFYVTNTKQEAVKNAEITITDYSPIITDNDGFAYIDLANGNYTFSVIANDHEEYSDDFEVNGENIVISVELIYVSIPTEQLISAMPYPNPFGNEIYIENEQLIKRVIISNVAGQKILDTTLNESIINTSEFKPGIYVITLVGHDGNYSIHKMIKQ